MAENPSPTPTPQPQPQPSPSPPASTQRPEHIPEQFWDADKSAPKVDDLGRSYTELRAKFSKGKEAYKAEYDTERLKARPEKPEGYEVKIPDGAKGDVVLLTERPAADFKPEAGKKYFVVNNADPLMQFWRQHCHAQGLGQDGFMAGLLAFADATGAKVPTADEQKSARAAEYAKLGEHGAARVDHVWGRLQAVLGEDAKVLDEVMGSAEAVAAVEKLLEKAGEPRFAAPGTQAATGNADSIRSEITKLSGDPEFQKKFLNAGHPGHAEALRKMNDLHAQLSRR